MRKVLLVLGLGLAALSCQKEDIKPLGTHAPIESQQEQLINKK